MNSVIIDTDPGIDDMLALLLLLASDNIELKMISLTYGNCSLFHTLQNVLSLMKVVADENVFRLKNNLEIFSSQRPAIHLGSTDCLKAGEDMFKLEQIYKENNVNATDVHGSDGLAGVHTSNPEFNAPQEWFKYFENGIEGPDNLPFTVGKEPSYKAIIELLKNEPEDTVTIIAIGPLTNLAKAASYDPQAFAKVKQVVSMGAALRTAGNITPLAEFNVYADPLAAAKVYALTSLDQRSVLPASERTIPMPRPLNLVIFPLDITHKHFLYKRDVERALKEHAVKYKDSILLNWVSKWLLASFANYGKLIGKGPDLGVLNLHDPLTAAYVLDFGEWGTQLEDVRVETSGQFSLGDTIVDDRGRERTEENEFDHDQWLILGKGNNVHVAVKSPVEKTFQSILLTKIMNFRPKQN